MAAQPKTKIVISQKKRDGINKNCGACRRGIAKTALMKDVPFCRTANPVSERTDTVPTPFNALCVPCGPTDGGCLADDGGAGQIGSERVESQIRCGAERGLIPDTSRLAKQQRMGPQRNSNPDRPSGRTLRAKRHVPSEEFSALQMEKIFRTAYRITRNREDAEDAMQDAYLRAILHHEDFDGRAKFSTWLTRIAINSSLMILRKRRSEKAASLNSTGDFEESTEFSELRHPAPDPGERYLQRERETALHDEIHGLRPTLKGVIELGHLGECSLRETAETLGLSVGAVKARLFHARRTLRNSTRLRRFRKDRLHTNRMHANDHCD